MNKGVRLTETWMHRALWLVALIFAGFLIGLGGKVIDSLGGLDPAPTALAMIDPDAAAQYRAEMARASKAAQEADEALEQARHRHEAAQANTRSARASFDNWIATRQATVRPEQDAELVARTRALDGLAREERAALAAVEAQQQARLDADQAAQKAQRDHAALLVPAQGQAEEAARRAELHVFLYRLALTLPLLAGAGCLFKYKRNGAYWPFAWGFILFALVAFFFELLPYLPSYGGYVRYVVGIVLTVLCGRWAILWLQAYLARQKTIETLPEPQRKTGMRYDLVLARIGKGVCPSCERGTNYQDATLSHCPHCGFCLFDRCPACSVRKNALMRFCFSCGTPANVSLAD
ncbi:serine endopeptidase [Massilia sp. WF1]|uniref:serine endopeptidase n=1 Tax=unclassified Massilia TaxID=2609279 RepID=UPI00064A7899|nr:MULTISPECIES: serine endopeptidase [unclassified Massilia]ALK96171.1 serine endopeptidase [Massilia sp. WG5]KLU34767.1 serine endopeptidase [Massilia sp. WF1]